jgi:hypothetical protein
MSSPKRILLQLTMILSEDCGMFMMTDKKQVMSWPIPRQGRVS